ncbi:hypothetical protein CEUSTIGMA_g12874.t1 [Chlamydomonas eustigma]|uniref:Integrase catalytic domain-containing protein n=1 Tax=Chlamydomonas eustigma TaxID=1157962 RepID=A0A250XQW8_9CHLO|nr:hypothetical protein CEUSTIGMA_g12874.t1 [Chlamydomonas eustigma]|eukprot:GAX85458.1 hypothetical protein CEUSTIGMA_g12874.t1 [Chlamydomonas eustigma]
MGGSRYIATFLDDYTNFSVVRLIKVKSQIPVEIKSVIAELERQTGLQVKAIRSDRGGEYINQTLQDYLKKKGIVQQLTAPYSPEQNMVSKNLWAEAVVTANRIRNCSPTTGHTKTPWELFYNVKPDVSNMRIFGSIAYVHTPKELRKKLDPKGKPGIFLGYEPHAKAYRVLVNGKVKISKDVVVEESKFILLEKRMTFVDIMNMSDEEEEEQISNVHVPAEDHMEQDILDIPPDVLPTATSQTLHHRRNSDGSGGDEDGRRVRSRIEEEPTTHRRSGRVHQPPSEWWRATDGDMTVLKVMPKLLNAEQRFARGKREDATAMAANQRVYKRDARQRSMRHDNKESRECHYCHKVGHIKKNCWKYQQEVLGQKGPKTLEKGNIAFAASSFSAITSEVLDQVWIIDSGASSHLTSRRELLQDYTMIPYATSFVVFGDGVKKPVAGTGTAIIQTKQGTVTLKNVLHVPDACANLVSIGKAAETGVNVTFHHGGCKLQSGTTVINVPKKNGVYMLTYSKEQRALTAMHQETAELWHQRYGHLSYSSLAQLVKKNMVTGINLSKEETARLDTDEFRRKVCSGCIAGKQQRNVAKPHPGSEPAITEKLGLIHMDVCGPIEPTSMGGSRYIAWMITQTFLWSA